LFDTRTSARPAGWSGDSHRTSLPLTHTAGTATSPKRHESPPPKTKPLPYTDTAVPPPAAPRSGDTPVTVSSASTRSVADVLLTS